MADGWAYYDANGERVRPSQAAFKGREVSVASGVPAPPNHASLGRTEYRDVHPIDQPEIRKNFKTFRELKAWFKEYSSTP